MPLPRVSLIDASSTLRAKDFFLNTWPMYVHELRGYGADFYTLDVHGRWRPHVSPHWVARVTPNMNLREDVSAIDPRQPLQRSHVIMCDGKPAGFVCVGLAPFKYMPADAERCIGELFVTHAYRGHGVSRSAVDAVLASYPPGRWALRVLPGNARALAFWARVLPQIDDAAHVTVTQGSAGDDVTWRFVTRDRSTHVG